MRSLRRIVLITWSSQREAWEPWDMSDSAEGLLDTFRRDIDDRDCMSVERELYD